MLCVLHSQPWLRMRIPLLWLLLLRLRLRRRCWLRRRLLNGHSHQCHAAGLARRRRTEDSCVAGRGDSGQ